MQQSLLEKAKHIRLAIFDVDGVLTTGKLFYSSQGDESRSFHVHDGQGIKSLLQTGVQVAIITVRQSESVTRRMKELGIQYVYQNQVNKMQAYDDLKKQLQLSDEQIAYTGDDLPDLAILRRVGLSVTVANAPAIIKQHAFWVTQAKGGNGAAREVCDMIMKAQDTLQGVIDSFL